MKRALPFVIRLVAVALIALASWVPSLHRPTSARSVVFVIDRSQSIPSTDGVWADRFVARAEEADPRTAVGIVEVDQEPRVTRWPAGEPIAGGSAQARLGTDLAGAVRLAAAILPSSGRRRIVVLSDGRGTTPGIERALAHARARGISTDVVPLGGGDPTEPQILGVEAVHPRVSEGETVHARAEISGRANSDVVVTWRRDGVVVANRMVHLGPRGRAVAELADPNPPQGIRVYDVQLAAHARAERLFVTVTSRPEVLLVTLTSREQPTLLLRALEDAADVHTHSLQTGPVPRERLSQVDLVVLVDLPLQQPGMADDVLSGLDEETELALLEYVSEEGGGLLVSGGAFGFGPDWASRPIARLLPVTIQDQGDVEDPPVAMAMMLDASGSMSVRVGEFTKIGLAVEGCLAAASTLRPEDRAAIAAVEDRTSWVQALAPTPEVWAHRDNVRAVQALGGGIYVYTALRDAYAVLAEAPEPIRHVVLFSDTSDSEEQYEGCPFGTCGARRRSAIDLAREARELGMTTTVVGIGSEHAPDAPFLQQLAAAGGGRYYETADGTDLRRIFVTETRAVSRTNLREESVVPRVGDPSPMLEGIGESPSLAGFVQTERRHGASDALITPDNRPILSSWRYGLGTVVALTSDLGGRWSTGWAEWLHGPQLFRQVVRHAMRRRSTRADMNVTLSGSAAEATLDVADAGAVDPSRIELVAVSERGVERTITAITERAGPGRYRIRGRTKGEPLVIARLRDERGRILAESHAQDSTRAELAGIGPDIRALREVARLGGGRMIETPEAAMAARGRSVPSRAPVWPWLLLLAALLVVVDLFVRRRTRAAEPVVVPGLVRAERAPSESVPVREAA